MTLFSSPAILALPAGFHTLTTKIWSLFNYRQARARRRRLVAAADPDRIIAARRTDDLGRRGYSSSGKYGAPRLILRSAA